MSFLKRIFGQKAEEDYETILSNLANDIQKRQLHLSEIRLRERRSTLLVTLYTLAAWVAYVSMWYLNALPGVKDKGDGNYARNRALEKGAKGLPVVIGPIVILFVRRVVQVWYTRKGDAEEKSLKELMKKRREKVEEIKKRTNYYSTRDLIQKYDEGSPQATPPRQRIAAGAAPATPQRPLVNTKQPNGNPLLQTPAPSAGLQAHLSPTTPNFPVGPPRKQWYDKLADALLGDDEAGVASPSSRYALICEKCFNHNGLVKENMWEDAQYVCPKCGHFNASVRTKRERPRQSVSPSQSAASSPAHSSTLSPPQQRRHEPPSPSSGGPNESERDLPTVDGQESMSMEVDSVGIHSS